MSNADTAFTILAGKSINAREDWLKTLPLSMLRAMADLAGIDSVELNKTEAIQAILENF